MPLVLIETAGNQSYIFATNKLRENVGASELTYQVGTRLVFDAVARNRGPSLQRNLGTKTRDALRDPKENPPLEQGVYPIELVLAASGKALLLCRDDKIGRAIIGEVTKCNLEAAPGIDAVGTILTDFELSTHSIHSAIGDIHRSLEKTRSRIPGPTQRHLRLPFAAECATSGLPAKIYATHDLPEAEWGPRSDVSLAKQAARRQWHDRIAALCVEHGVTQSLPTATTELEKLGCDWIAVIHADGNGLGQVFLTFDRGLGPRNEEDPAAHNRAYIDELRGFSLALDDCTERAFCKALGVLRPARYPEGDHEVLPIVPLVLGGDDLTVVCDGRQALRFIHAFLEAFEEETHRCAAITSVMTRVRGQDRVTSCAGVAIVKPHFPFFSAYTLAEKLLESAKKLGKSGTFPFSAVDFHVLYDASAPELKRIRGSWTVDREATLLFARPYAVSPHQGPTHRRFDDLVQCVDAITATDDEGRRLLPNSMLHELREGLFLGRAEADARLQLALGRHDEASFGSLIHPSVEATPSLFWTDTATGKSHTSLLDAMDLAAFWKEERP